MSAETPSDDAISPACASPAPSPTKGSRASPVAAGAPASPILSIERLSAAYDGSLPVLEDVSLELARGELVAVLGANGAGKSTLLRTLSGLLPCLAGRIIFEGVDITRLAPDRRVVRGLVQVPEGRQMLAALTVEENLLLGGYVHRRDPAGLRRTLDEVFALFPRLSERRTQAAGLLSGGEQQMVALGRAMMGRPRALLLDEPSFGLAPKVVSDTFRVIDGLRSSGLPILLIEQNASKALAVADRAVVLRAGRVVARGTAAELAASEEVRRSYLGD